MGVRRPFQGRAKDREMLSRCRRVCAATSHAERCHYSFKQIYQRRNNCPFTNECTAVYPSYTKCPSPPPLNEPLSLSDKHTSLCGIICGMCWMRVLAWALPRSKSTRRDAGFTSLISQWVERAKGRLTRKGKIKGRRREDVERNTYRRYREPDLFQT